jgi:hypothetical protein
LLTAQERDRFASWLERELETGKGMIQQMEKMPNMQLFIDKQKREMAAYLIVARILRSTEDMTIG